MVLPVYKVLSLVIRVFSKPIVTYIKQVTLKNDAHSSHPLLRKGFISLGNVYNKGETWVNRKFMKIQSQFAYKPLNDQLAIEKGIQFFFEILFYSLVIGLPLYEMVRASEEAKVKSAALEQKLKKITDKLEQIQSKQANKDTKPQKQEHSLAKEEQKNMVQQGKILQKSGDGKQTKPVIAPIKQIKIIFPGQKIQIYPIYFPYSYSYAEPQTSQSSS